MRQDKLEDVLGVVLVGGGSRRMGRDKALIEFAGQTLLGRALGVLQEVMADVVIIGAPRPGYSDFGARIVADIRPDRGPVGGIHTGLVEAAGRSVFVLACDMPFVSPALVRWITAAELGGSIESFDQSRMSGRAARVVRDRHGSQPLCALYASGCLAAVESALDQECLSAQELVRNLDTEYLMLQQDAVWYDPGLLTNINALTDLTRLGEGGASDL